MLETQLRRGLKAVETYNIIPQRLHCFRRFVASENESERMVCANVFGPRWSTKLLALME